MMRERRGWSQEQLAATLGVAPDAIDRIERGKGGQLRLLPQLAAALNVAEEWLRTGKGRMIPAPQGADAQPELSIDLLKDLMLGVDKALKAHKMDFDNEEKAELVGALYTLALTDERSGAPEATAAADNIIRYRRRWE